MEQSDLIMSIVFDDSVQAFASDDLSEDFCKLLMQTSPSLCKQNKNIMTKCNKYTAVYLYENIHDCIVSSVLDIAFTSLNYNKELDKYLQILQKSHDDIQKGFMDLVISEYKEYVYLRIMENIEEIELRILDKYKALITLLYKPEDISQHYTDTSLDIYVGKKYYHCGNWYIN